MGFYTELLLWPLLESLRTLALEIAQSRSYSYTLGPKVGVIIIPTAPGIGHSVEVVLNGVSGSFQA